MRRHFTRLLVTGWSNTVFEAALRGVPSLTINATRGAAPMPFAEEGLSEGAMDPESAADLARRFLEEDFRAAAVARARERLPEHLGPQDGHAAERAADLVEAAAQGRLPRVKGSA